MHIERRVGRERGQRAGRVVGLVHAGAIHVLALAGIEIAAADEYGAILSQRRIEAGQAAPVVEAPAEQLCERHAAEEAARRRLGRVEVAMGVDPDQRDAGMALAHGRQHRRHQRAFAHHDDRRAGGHGLAALGEHARKVGRQRILGRALPEPDDAVGEVHLARAVAARVLGDLHVLVPEAQPRGELDEPLLRLERGHAAAGELADEGLEHARRLTKRDASS